LTTHVLDLSSGEPAAGLRIELFRADTQRELLGAAHTNADGRCDAPLLEGDAFKSGLYELDFHAGAWLAERQEPAPDFLDVIPIRFRITDTDRHYHVPLLLSAYGYSTYRGS